MAGAITSSSLQPQAGKYLRSHQPVMATVTAPSSAAAAARRKKCKKSLGRGSAGGHLGPVGSSAGCSGAKLLFLSPFLNFDFSWEHEHPALME
jgi:hypothetical protein